MYTQPHRLEEPNAELELNRAALAAAEKRVLEQAQQPSARDARVAVQTEPTDREKVFHRRDTAWLFQAVGATRR